jgi:hypothetical protein
MNRRSHGYTGEDAAQIETALEEAVSSPWSRFARPRSGSGFGLQEKNGDC